MIATSTITEQLLPDTKNDDAAILPSLSNICLLYIIDTCPSMSQHSNISSHAPSHNPRARRPTQAIRIASMPDWLDIVSNIPCTP